MCLNIRSDMLKIRYAKIRLGTIWAKAHMGQGPYGLGPIWARAHMSQGPCGPGPAWARAHMGQGPYGPGPIGARAHMGPGPFLVGRTPHQKTHPGKKSPNCVFLVVFWKQKRCATSVRSFWRRYRAEISVMCVRKRRFPFCEQMSKFCIRFAKNDHREPCVTVCPSEK